MSIFVLHAGIITVRHEIDPLKPVFDIEEVIRRWDENSDLLRMGSPALLHGLLDVIVDGQFDTIQQLDDAIEDIEGDLFDERTLTRKIQRETYRIRKELVELRRVVLPMREVINTIMRRRPSAATPSNSTAGTQTSTTMSSAQPSGRSRCATWSRRCSRRTCPCRTPG